MKKLPNHRGILIAVIAALLVTLTVVGSFVLGGKANPVSNALSFITTPVRNGAAAFVGWAEGIYNYSFRYTQLQEENDSLRKQIAALESTARQGEEDSRENVRLRGLLDLRAKRQDFDFESAKVTARSSTNWSATLTLSKGTQQDVAVGDCAVDEAGNLVGIIGEVGTNWSTLLTIIDSGIEMGGVLSRTDSTAILEGDFALMADGKLKLTYLPEDKELLTGDLVLTSGKSGTNPAGLVAGSIDAIHTDPSGMTRYAVITPAADLDSLIEVFIIRDFDVVE